jgi:hypothetical protein
VQPQPVQPQPAQPQPVQPVQPQAGYAEPADEPWTPAPAHEEPAGEIGTVSFVPRLMLAPFGSGTLECEGDGCVTNEGVDYDHKSAFGFGADVMFRVGSVMRLGPGLAYMTEHDIELDGSSDDYTIGSEFTLSFVLDAAIPVSPTVWLVPRGQIGLLLLFPGGDLRDNLDELKTQCEAAGISGCDSLEGARPGVQGGLGFGVMFAVSPNVRLRADAMYQFYSVNVYTLEGPGVDAAVNFNGSRGFLMAGAEF